MYQKADVKKGDKLPVTTVRQAKATGVLNQNTGNNKLEQE